MMRKVFVSVFAAAVILLTATTVVSAQASPAASPTPTPTPQFTLNAGTGKFPPGSPLNFMDSWVNNVKLMFKFSAPAKITKHMDIADKDIIHMKNAVDKDNMTNLQTAATNYKTEISAIRKIMLKNKLNADTKGSLDYRILLQEQAFTYLLANSNDKQNPVISDAWSQLQNLKLSMQ